MNLTTILDDCLERLAAGESVAQCLARYPEAAPELAPLLAAAEQMRAFATVRLSQGQRLRAKVALREELAVQKTRRDGAAYPLGLTWARWRLAPVAALVAVLLFSTVAFSAVAASQPGDLAYPLRLAVERAPARVQFSPGGRVAAELAFADRRLSDVSQDGGSLEVALQALLSGDAEAVGRADALPAEEQVEVGERVAQHAQELTQLAAQAADPSESAALLGAASEASALASRLNVVTVLPASTPTSTVALTQAPEPSATPRPALIPTLSMTPRPSATLTSVVPGPSPKTGTVVATATRTPAWTPRYTPWPQVTITPVWTPRYTPWPQVTITPVWTPRYTPWPKVTITPVWTPRYTPWPKVTITPVWTPRHTPWPRLRSRPGGRRASRRGHSRPLPFLPFRLSRRL